MRVTSRDLIVWLGISVLLLRPGGASAAEDWAGLARELLDMPAPAADWRRTAQPFPPGGSPADDAPLEVLAAYWSSDEFDLSGGAPSAAARLRLLDAVEADPQCLVPLLHWLPETPEACTRLKALYDRLPDDKPSITGRRGDGAILRDWLMTRGPYFREELVRIVEGLKKGEYGVDGAEEMVALARLDWVAAEPIVRRHAASTQPHVSAAALGVLGDGYARNGEEARAGEARARLRAFAEDRAAPASVRDAAVTALMSSLWPGRDEWFLSLFGDETLVECEEGNTLYSPLQGPVADDPERWIPRVSKLVGGPVRAAHDNAVGCLIQFQLEQARADALRPLLPWLSDPAWSAARDRLRLIQSLDRVDLPESVPGLLWVLRNEGDFEQAGAAEALGHHRAGEAGPALREAFKKGVRGIHERAIVGAMLACGELEDAEIVEAVEAHARDRILKPDRAPQDLFGDARRPAGPAALGAHLADLARDRDAAAERLLERAAALRADEPAVAAGIASILGRWTSAAIDRDIVARLGSGALDTSVVLPALDRAERLRAGAADGLRGLVTGGGSRAGVAAAVLSDADVSRDVLARGGEDPPARLMLLACARLLRAPLPIIEVGRLLEADDKLLAEAAERYLVSEDSRAARELIWARYPGEVLILGGRMDFDPGHTTFDSLDRTDGRLRQELRRRAKGDAGAPEEVYALLSEGYWGGHGQCVIRVGGGAARLTIEHPGGKRLSRRLTAAEFDGLRDLIDRYRIDDLPTLETAVNDGVQYEYLHLTPAGGRRVFMNNPGSAGTAGTSYDLLVRRFKELGRTGKFEARYPLQETIPGAAVLLWDEDRPVASVWARGDDVRVGIGLHPGRADADEHPPLAWHALSGDRLRGAADAPPDWPAINFMQDVPADLRRRFPPHMNRHAWLARSGEDTIRAAADWYAGEKVGGLWRCRPGRAPQKICSQAFARPVVAPNGKWAVAARSDAGWARPKSIVRIDLSSGEQHRIDLPRAEVAEAIAHVPAHDKVLLAVGSGNGRPEHHLLEVATGKTEPVVGEFDPFSHLTYRPLQPTGRPDEVWAAVRVDGTAAATRIGRYDTRQFDFTEVLTLPGISFTSMDLWVDEPAGFAYVTNEGDLLRIPIPGAGRAPGAKK